MLTGLEALGGSLIYEPQNRGERLDDGTPPTKGIAYIPDLHVTKAEDG